VRAQAWQPILTPKWVIITFLLIGIPFIIIGFVLKNASDGVGSKKKHKRERDARRRAPRARKGEREHFAETADKINRTS
jgi:hypothetical protein